MSYRQRGKIYSIENDAIRIDDEANGKSYVIPLSDVTEVRIWILNIESGCLIKTGHHGMLSVRCGFVTEPAFMSFVIGLHVALLQGGHSPRYLRGNKIIWGGGWVVLAVTLLGCILFSFQTNLAALSAMSFWNIALLFGMWAAVICFSFACIRAGRVTPYEPANLLSPRKKYLNERMKRRSKNKKEM